MKELVIMFMTYAILGWFWETPYESLRQRKLLNRGFLFGPMIPIYGITSSAFVKLTKLIEPILPENRVLLFIVVVLYNAVIASVFEYVTSYGLELMFKTRWWDYTDRPININGRVALECSLFWGFCGFIIWGVINGSLVGFISSLPRIDMILTIAYTIFFVDLLITIRQLITLNIILEKMTGIYNQLSGRVSFKVDGINGEIKLRKEQLQESFSSTKKEVSDTIVMLTNKTGVTLSEGQKHLINNYNKLLESAKHLGRFYHNYPTAQSNRFKKLLKIVRYKKDHEE